MATRSGRRSCNIIGRLGGLVLKQTRFPIAYRGTKEPSSGLSASFSHAKTHGRRQIDWPSPLCSHKWEKVPEGRMRALHWPSRIAFGLALVLALAAPAGADVVRAEDYQSFWLWAGVEPQGALAQARELYLLAGEVSDRGQVHVVSQRSAIPHVASADVWIVYRAQTIEWNDAVLRDVLAHVESWRAAGNKVVGLQIDFDAGTKHLERYAGFLQSIRARLPLGYRLGVTGLLDWSAHADPAGLDALAGVVDEVVLQIYQGRHVIPGYEAYLAKLSRLKVPFRIGLLQGGDWTAPASLEGNPRFRGCVVFLVNGAPK